MNTRRYPRTLEEAFGPYTSRRIDEPCARPSSALRAVYALALVALAALLVGVAS